MLSDALQKSPLSYSDVPIFKTGDHVCFRQPEEESDDMLSRTLERFLEEAGEGPLTVLSAQPAKWSSYSPQLVTLQALTGERALFGDGRVISTYFLTHVPTDA